MVGEETEQAGAVQIPSYRVVQQVLIKGQGSKLVDVGTLWARKGNNNKVYYIMKIEKLHLLVYENDRSSKAERKAEREKAKTVLANGGE